MVWYLLCGVGFWITPKRPDDAADRASGRACSSNAADKLNNPRRDCSQTLVKLVRYLICHTPLWHAFRAERMAVVASTAFCHLAEAEIAHTHTNKQNDVETRWLPRCAVSTLWTKSVPRAVHLHHHHYHLYHRHHHHHHHRHHPIIIGRLYPMGLKTEKKEKEIH